MKNTPVIRMALAGLMALASAGLSFADPVKDLEKSYLVRYDEANGKRKSQLETLQGSYVTALKREMEKAQSSGKLERVIPYRDEISDVKKGLDPLPALSDVADYQLKKMRGKFTEARQKILSDHATTLVGLADKMVKVLGQRETELTKAGKLEEALAVRKMKEIYGADEEIKAARNVLKYGGGKGKAKPAYQLRRTGDNLEVLVFRDHRGKVTMDSEVENVREKSGEGKELGDTHAKVLGEFVGAKGYEADTYVSFHQTFDGKDNGGMVLNHLVGKHHFEMAGTKGLHLSISPKGTTPYATVGQRLVPPKGLGSYRITSRYMIPESSKSIAGLRFTQGPMGHTIGKISLGTGKWVEGEILTKSQNELTSLLLFLLEADGKKIDDMRSDYLVLGDLKVEQMTFGACIQQDFTSDDGSSSQTDDPKKQEVFISNGEFVKP